MKHTFLLVSKIIYIVFVVSLLAMLIILFQEEEAASAILFSVVGILLIISAVFSVICCLIMFVLEMRIEWNEQGIRCVGTLLLEIVVIFAFFALYECVILKERMDVGSYLARAVVIVISSRGIVNDALKEMISTEQVVNKIANKLRCC